MRQKNKNGKNKKRENGVHVSVKTSMHEIKKKRYNATQATSNRTSSHKKTYGPIFVNIVEFDNMGMVHV